MNKVTLPREVAEAVDAVKHTYSKYDIITSLRNVEGFSSELTVIANWANGDDTTEREDRIISALVSGFEVEKTPEEAVKEYFVYHRNRRDSFRSGTFENVTSKSECAAIQQTLDLLGIKIEGVNAE